MYCVRSSDSLDVLPHAFDIDCIRGCDEQTSTRSYDKRPCRADNHAADKERGYRVGIDEACRHVDTGGYDYLSTRYYEFLADKHLLTATLLIASPAI